MKRLVIASLLSSALFVAYGATHTDHARVISAEPVMENYSVARNECSNFPTHERERAPRNLPQRQERQYGGAIVGGLAGGVIGHQFGAGAGKDAATALGVVIGAIAGDQLSNRDQQVAYDVRQPEHVRHESARCHTVYDTQSRISSYRVAYEYRGQHYNTIMRTHPGQHLPVRVSVEPMEQ